MKSPTSSFFLLLILILLCLSASVLGQSWSGVLDPSRAIDWSQAGVPGGIPTTRTQCVTPQCNTVANGTVTTSSVKAAISSAPDNSYVLIPGGTFTISGGIDFNSRSYVTLRGMGSNATFLNFTGGTSGCGSSGYDICAGSSDINYWQSPSNSASWTGTNGVAGTYTKGATSIILSSTTNLAVGAPIILDQVDDSADNGGLWVGCENQNSRCGNDGPSGYQRNGPRGQQQMVNVTSISGSGPYTVGITPGIYASNWRTSQSPGAWWATDPIFGDAVEDLSLNNGGGTGIIYFNCSGCWVARIRSIRSSTTGTGWFHVGFQLSNKGTVRDSYFYGYDGDAYGIEPMIASDLLIENNIFQRPGKIVFNSDCEGCVVAYNFGVNNVYGGGSSWLEMGQYYHSIALFVLDEGNIGAGLWADGYHGSHVLNTAFRNRYNGREQNNGVATSSNTAAVQLAPGARYHNIIGNVLGTVGYHTSYKATPSNDTNWTAVISAGLFEGTGGTDTVVAPTTMFWGNWDTATNTVRWCGNSSDTAWSSTCASTSEIPSSVGAYANSVPSSEKLPASFYQNAKPSWWPASKAWPAIGPDVTGGTVGQCTGGSMATSSCTASSQCAGGGICSVVAGGRVVSTPAMDCYLTKMGGVANGTGSALAFDSSACYSSSNGGGGVNAPTGLTAIVH